MPPVAATLPAVSDDSDVTSSCSTSPACGDRLPVLVDDEHRLGVRVPMEPLADRRDLLLLLVVHHHRGRLILGSSPGRHATLQGSSTINTRRPDAFKLRTIMHGVGELHTAFAAFDHRTATSSRRPSRARAMVSLVGVLQLAADGHAGGDAGDPDAERLEQPGQVHRGRLALDVGAGGQDDLGDRRRRRRAAPDQLGDAQVVGADAVERREHPVQHVVAAAEAARRARWRGGPGLRDRRRQAGVAPRVAHSAHGSRSVRLQHTEQRRIFSRTSRIAAASAAASSGGRAGCGTRAGWRSSRRCRAAWPAAGSGARWGTRHPVRL